MDSKNDNCNNDPFYLNNNNESIGNNNNNTNNSNSNWLYYNNLHNKDNIFSLDDETDFFSRNNFNFDFSNFNSEMFDTTDIDDDDDNDYDYDNEDGNDYISYNHNRGYYNDNNSFTRAVSDRGSDRINLKKNNKHSKHRRTSSHGNFSPAYVRQRRMEINRKETVKKQHLFKDKEYVREMKRKKKQTKQHIIDFRPSYFVDMPLIIHICINHYGDSVYQQIEQHLKNENKQSHNQHNQQSEESEEQHIETKKENKKNNDKNDRNENENENGNECKAYFARVTRNDASLRHMWYVVCSLQFGVSIHYCFFDYPCTERHKDKTLASCVNQENSFVYFSFFLFPCCLFCFVL